MLPRPEKLSFRDGIVAPAGSDGFVAPVGAYIACLFQTAEGGVECSFLQLVPAAGFFHDILVDLIAIAVLFQKVGQDYGI